MFSYRNKKNLNIFWLTKKASNVELGSFFICIEMCITGYDLGFSRKKMPDENNESTILSHPKADLIFVLEAKIATYLSQLLHIS